MRIVSGHSTSVASVVLLALLSVACTGEAPSGGKDGGASGPDSGPIVVGEFGSMTGSEATFGQSTHAGIMVAVEEQNAAGGVKGRQVKVLTYDTEGKTQTAGSVVTRLITDDHVVAVLGEVASSLSIAGGEVAQKYGVPMITPSSTNPRVTTIGDMIFRVCFLDDFQGYVMAKFARENLKAQKIAILFDQSQAYATGLRDYVKTAFEQLGGTVVTAQAYSKGDQDFNAQLTTIRGLAPDVIVIPGYYTDAANIAIQARKLRINVPLVGGDGWDSAQLAAIGGKAMLNTFYSNHYSHQDPKPAVQNFVAKYKQANGGATPDGLAALGYDAARILFAAMERAPSLSGKDLAATIAATKDFAGVTGTISIDENRNARKTAVVLEMKEDGTGQIIPFPVTTIEPQ
jgi:branched-chain amino acid transport system substrate-binding protein